MFCPSANVVAPLDNGDGEQPSMIIRDQDTPEDKHDVIIEKDEEGNSFLHLVMPANSVNFLNGYDQDSIFNQAEGKAPLGSDGRLDTDYDQMLIEVGCKVYEVNKVLYKSRPSASAEPGSPTSNLKISTV